MRQCPLVNSKIRIAATIILLSATFSVGIAETWAQPNVVVVMADDIGLGDLSYYHRQHSDQPPSVITPNLDRLIESGMRFSDAHSPSSLCPPTRFSMMTGNFVHRNSAAAGSFSPVKDSLIEPDFTTIARIAKAGGYHTAFFGKWGLGSVWNSRDADFSKIEQGAVYFGFDYAFELPQGIQNWPHAFYENQQWMPISPDSKLINLTKEQAKHHKSGIGDSNWDPALAGPMLAKKAVAYIERQTTSIPTSRFSSTTSRRIPASAPISSGPIRNRRKR